MNVPNSSDIYLKRSFQVFNALENQPVDTYLFKVNNGNTRTMCETVQN